MNYQLPVTAKCCINIIPIEFCYGDIPDIFRELWFDPIKELELPDTKVTDEEFQDFLSLYRHMLLEESQCN